MLFVISASLKMNKKGALDLFGIVLMLCPWSRNILVVMGKWAWSLSCHFIYCWVIILEKVLIHEVSFEVIWEKLSPTSKGQRRRSSMNKLGKGMISNSGVSFHWQNSSSPVCKWFSSEEGSPLHRGLCESMPWLWT